MFDLNSLIPGHDTMVDVSLKGDRGTVQVYALYDNRPMVPGPSWSGNVEAFIRRARANSEGFREWTGWAHHDAHLRDQYMARQAKLSAHGIRGPLSRDAGGCLPY